MTTKKKRFDSDTIMLVLIIALIAIFVINMFAIFSSASQNTASASGAPSSVPKSLENLPQMVGGC
ncbi:hypothetical protein HYU06_02325 [Candidatus Woesearchaeota archaeon]|nr:hypothetical protein [Candidatus Woesearchaeota archaeon]